MSDLLTTLRTFGDLRAQCDGVMLRIKGNGYAVIFAREEYAVGRQLEDPHGFFPCPVVVVGVPTEDEIKRDEELLERYGLRTAPGPEFNLRYKVVAD